MKQILLVGAAGGVGSAVAAQLVARGDQVFGTVLNAAEAQAANAAVPGIATLDLADLGDADSLAAVIRGIARRAGTLDAVIVCAAISPYGPAETTKLSVARRAFEINCLSGLAIYQATLPALRASKGRLIFTSSMAGRAGMPFIGAYVASKFALEGLADVMRREAQPQGVDVVLVEPGGIRTGMVAEQLRSIVGEIEALSGEARNLYLGLYQSFQRLAQESYDSGVSSPEAIASIIVEALDAAHPQARYPAGADAKALIDMTRTMPDDALDNVFAQMFVPSAA